MEMDFSGPPPQAKTLEEAQQIINVLWEICGQLTKRCDGLEKRVHELEEKLRTNSRNSSNPPSSDKHQGNPDGRKKKRRQHGGQPGHQGSYRALLPTKEVDEVKTVCPTEICGCGGQVEVSNTLRRHQVYELPEIKPIVTEYQLHGGRCSDCGKTYQSDLPEGVSWNLLGPRAMALVGCLSGAYRLSKRQIESLLKDLYGLPISLGTLSSVESIIADTLSHPFTELHDYIQTQPVLHADETGHKQCGQSQWLWGAITHLASVFFIRKNRNQTVAKELLGRFSGTLVSDRYGAYNMVEDNRRQLCWAHLIREFTKIAERSGIACTIGKTLLIYTDELFKRWHDYKKGVIDRTKLLRRMVLWRKRIEGQLQLAVCSTTGKTKKTCKRILKQKESLWTFLTQENVEPTNNLAERMLRHYVIWRKQSFGTQSERGNRFIERIMSTVATCKQQQRNILNYLYNAISAHFANLPAPSLIPNTS